MRARVGAVLCLSVLMGQACGRAVPDSPRARLRFATGMPGANFYVLGDALAREYARALPNLDIVVTPTGGSGANLEAVERGEADIALSHADITYLAFVGRLEDGRAAFTRLRGIAMLHVAPVHVVVGRGSGIESVAGLRGRRISIGRPSWAKSSTAARVMRAFGLSFAEETFEPLRYDEAAQRIGQGTLDALLVTGTYPMSAVTTAAAAGARILPLEGEPIDRLRRAYPFFIRTTIPAGTYPGQSEAIHTIGVHTLLVCRADLDEALVHDLTERLFAALPTVSTPDIALGQVDLAQAPATPIPLHRGAARYYREQELAR